MANEGGLGHGGGVQEFAEEEAGDDAKYQSESSDKVIIKGEVKDGGVRKAVF